MTPPNPVPPAPPTPMAQHEYSIRILQDQYDRIFSELNEIKRKQENFSQMLQQLLLHNARLEETIKVLQMHDERLHVLHARHETSIGNMDRTIAEHARQISNLELTARAAVWIAGGLFMLSVTAILNTFFGRF